MSRQLEIKIKLPSFLEICTFFKKRCLSLFIICKTWIKRALYRVIKDIRNKKYRGLVVLVPFVGCYSLWGFASALMWCLFFSFLFYDWENRIIAVFALVSLIICPILLIFGMESAANRVAEYVYFFLLMTVILQIVEYFRHPERRGSDVGTEK
jgi:hypothetical protein